MEMLIDFDVGWRRVDEAITRFLRLLHGVDAGSFSSEEYIELYTTVNNMCHSPRDYKEQLHHSYKRTLEHYTKSVLSSLNDKHGVYLLKELVMAWKNHKVFVRWLSKFFAPLDRYYIEPNLLMPLRELGISCFYDIVFNERKTTLATIVIEMVNDERDGQHIDRALVKDVLDIYVEIGRGSLGLYKLYFEQAFCKGTADYYSFKAQTWMLEDTCPQFMLKAEECLQKEKERVAHYMHVSTEPKLLEDTFFELITRRAEQILWKETPGCRLLLLNGKTDDLSRIYRLFSKMEGGLSQVSKLLKELIIEEGMSWSKDITDAANSQKDFVRKTIELHDRQQAYVNNCFGNNAEFHKALKVAFDHFWCKELSGCSGVEALAVFCDDILKKGGKRRRSYEDVEEALDKVVFMVRYIGDKDLFLAFLRSKLGKRLLFDRSDILHELSLISKLNVELDLGEKCTHKMTGMVNEILSGRNHQENFENYMSDHQELDHGVNFNPTVLTMGLWPTYKTFKLNLPVEMDKCVKACEKYYKSISPPRKLTWIYSIGECNILAHFDAKSIELIVSAYQAAVLLLFNETDRLSRYEIVTQLNLPNYIVINLLESLSCGRYKILVKEQSNETISRRDTFQFNKKFTHDMDSIKVPLPRTDKETVVKDLFRERKASIEACIVRIMKSRRVMSHNQLVEECVAKLSLTFKPETKDIKKRIDDLITREYLERDREVSHTYRYLP